MKKTKLIMSLSSATVVLTAISMVTTSCSNNKLEQPKQNPEEKPEEGTPTVKTPENPNSSGNLQTPKEQNPQESNVSIAISDEFGRVVLFADSLYEPLFGNSHTPINKKFAVGTKITFRVDPFSECCFNKWEGKSTSLLDDCTV
ncbi:MAG: hypothetical protein HUJ52_01430, partial [Malacoplasma sp.]|nr:hypothetical protein [Malacoplasma sp.]